jgi:hypothetical protein
MRNDVFKILALAASISLAGCASPYNAGQYALDNQRLTSETSLEAVEPDEQFSDAMKIMYDYSQVDIDYKNNLDEPYLKGGSAFKDTMSLGGTASLIFSGAGVADIASFGLGTSYRKEIDRHYTENLYMRVMSLPNSITEVELNKIIILNRQEMAKNIELAYNQDGVELKYFSPTLKTFVANSQIEGTVHIIPTYNDGLGSKLCRKKGSGLEEHLISYGYVYGGNCYASTEPNSLNQTPQVRLNDTNSQIYGFSESEKYIILFSYLPDDFPTAYLASGNTKDFLYRPSFLWLDRKHKYVELYTPEIMAERLKLGHISQGPELKHLSTNTLIPFLYQQ